VVGGGGAGRLRGGHHERRCRGEIHERELARSGLDDSSAGGKAAWHGGGDSGTVRYAARCGSSPSASRMRRAAPRGPS
jgi:hypothetical protein